MNTTEDLVSGLVKHLTGGYKTQFHTQTGEVYEVNWEKPWKRFEMIPELEKQTGEKFPPSDQLHSAFPISLFFSYSFSLSLFFPLGPSVSD